MPKRNLAWILIVGMIALLMWQLPQTIAGRDSVLKAFGPLVDARAQIRKRFVEKVEDRELVNAAVDAGIRAMIRELDDRHATYLNESEYGRFQERTNGRYGGIGVEVRATGEGLEVLSREKGSPAVRAGILPGDLLTHIDGKPTRGLPLVESVNHLLNGPADTKVTLTVLTPGQTPRAEPRELSVYRAVIKLDPLRGWSRSPAGGWRFMVDAESGIAYIRLIKFTSDVDERLGAEIEGLMSRNMRGLVLDLRENTGGLLDSAREVADQFLDNGLIVRTQGRMVDEKQWWAMREGTYPAFPMAILVNGTTASAAEIVAGALRDHKRALVVGEQTYGKGSVQEVVELSRNHGAIKLTTAYYYLPDGECIHKTVKAAREGTWGVRPNLVVNLTDLQRGRWQAAWRNIGRELAATSNGEVVISEDAPDSPESIRNAANALLDADLQFRKAYDYLLHRLHPAGGGPDRKVGRVENMFSSAL